MKIAAFSDLHVKTLKYHEEYLAVFQEFYKDLREQKPDVIVCAGDIAHSKVVLSPEYFSIAAKLFKELASIAPLYILAGNHDASFRGMTLRNASRLDAITPIIEALDNSNIHYMKQSGEYNINDNIVLNAMSLFDVDGWMQPTDPSKINVAVFHGAIIDASTDVGYTVDRSSGIDLSYFDSFDAAIFGDIHRRQFFSNTRGYVGSLIQQNHGEGVEKGYSIWLIKNKNDISVEFRPLRNPKPFITVNLDLAGNVPANLEIPVGSHVRVVAHSYISLDKMRKSLDVVKSKYLPEDISFVNKIDETKLQESVAVSSVVRGENLRYDEVQERMIRDYLKDFKPDDETMTSILKLNNQYNAAIKNDEEVARNVQWSVKKIEWDNLFNYGSGNYMNYEQLSGVAALLGKSFVGKTSTIDALLFGLFNTTSKNERKNVNVVNQHKNDAVVRLWLEANGISYRIERRVEKYVKRLHGVETIEAKTDVDFWEMQADGIEISRNGDTRSDTDRNIRTIFGTVEDFLLTSLSSQHGGLQYIFEGSTKRKEILARFLDLDSFDKKFKLAKEDSSTIKGALKRVEGIDYDTTLSHARTKLHLNEKEAQRVENKLTEINKTIADNQNQIDSFKQQLALIPKDIKEITETEEELAKKLIQQDALTSERDSLLDRNEELNKLIAKLNHLLDTFDIEGCRKQQDLIEQLSSEARKIEEKVAELNRNKLTNDKKTQLLLEVPCGEQFPACKFIRDAFKAKTENEYVCNNLKLQSEQLEKLTADKEALQPTKIEDLLYKYAELASQKTEFEQEVLTNQTLIEKDENALSVLIGYVSELQQRIAKSKADQKLIDSAKSLLEQLSEAEKLSIKYAKELSRLTTQRLEAYKTHGKLEGEINSVTEKIEERETLRNEFASYDLFMRCMHSNGISYDIIKSMLPVLNNEVAKVLANIVDFEVFFENNDDRLDIFIKHPKHESRPIEMGSGAEKTIAAMAIRLALTKIGNLPKFSTFILDEPATGLDEERMEGFIRVFDLLKLQFRLVILISHLDSLKDVADLIITIDKVDGYASVRI